jgi:hypothetical protein
VKKLILIILLALVSTGAWGEYLVLGAGTYGCGKFVEGKQKRNDDYDAIMHWVSGVITGVNIERDKEFADSALGENLDFETTSLWFEYYCKANPLDNVARATFALVDELTEREQSQ